MSQISIFHGSSGIIEHPVFGAGKPYNDYGRGFYCTESIEFAKEWAVAEGTDGYANHYLLNTDALEILDLSDQGYSVLNWLAILMENRIGRLSSPIEKQGRDYLLENFLPEYRHFDVIKGYRADDSYFSFARSFVSNTISLEQLSYAIRLGQLGKQIVLMSEKAFGEMTYMDYSIAEHGVYYPIRKARDDEAREAFRKELEESSLNGVFMRDIIREKMRNGDERIQ